MGILKAIKTHKKHLWWFIPLVLVLIQFISVDLKNPEVIASQDFINMTNPPADVAHTIKVACYDCHSNETKYPWYFNVAPVSWWLKRHIDKGRMKVNYSIWGTYKASTQEHNLGEAYSFVEKDWMPIIHYKLVHPEARLSAEQKAQLLAWLQSQIQEHEQ